MGDRFLTGVGLVDRTGPLAGVDPLTSPAVRTAFGLADPLAVLFFAFTAGLPRCFDGRGRAVLFFFTVFRAGVALAATRIAFRAPALLLGRLRAAFGFREGFLRLAVAARPRSFGGGPAPCLLAFFLVFRVGFLVVAMVVGSGGG